MKSIIFLGLALASRPCESDESRRTTGWAAHPDPDPGDGRPRSRDRDRCRWGSPRSRSPQRRAGPDLRGGHKKHLKISFPSSKAL
jgi:hypothetical protein